MPHQHGSQAALHACMLACSLQYNALHGQGMLEALDSLNAVPDSTTLIQSCLLSHFGCQHECLATSDRLRGSLDSMSFNVRHLHGHIGNIMTLGAISFRLMVQTNQD